jgi:UDP-glucose 4-epimerase
MNKGIHCVTGGAGFIGSHLVRALLALGRPVRVVDDLSSGFRRHVPAEAEFVEADVVGAAGEAVRGAEVVYHLAAQVSVPKSVEDPLASLRATAESVVAVLQAADRAGVRRVVYASSSAVYGDGPGLPRCEIQTPAPLSPYAIAKLCGERYAMWWGQRGRLETVSLRFFNVYGPRQDPASPYAAAVPRFVRQVREGDAVTVFGDGSQTRDFTYVGDVVRGILAAAERPGVSGRVYNVATGRSVTVLDVVAAVGEALGIAPRVRHAARREGDVLHSSACTCAARRDLAFEAAVGLAEGLRATVAEEPALEPTPLRGP